jgi:hypothetical protein
MTELDENIKKLEELLRKGKIGQEFEEFLSLLFLSFKKMNEEQKMKVLKIFAHSRGIELQEN